MNRSIATAPFLAAVMIIVACGSIPPLNQSLIFEPIADNSSTEMQEEDIMPALPTNSARTSNRIKMQEEDIMPALPTDLWESIEDGYGFAPVLYDKSRVRKQVDFLKGEALIGTKKRAHLFLHYIYEELRKRNLPTELALLPAVESSFDPYAYSPAGAAGLWQFTRSTGRAFGLEENWWYSQRRDFKTSTRAALDYLEQLYARYENWELALAAYNAGPSRVDRAIAYNQNRNRPTDYWHLSLPRETHNYVPRLIAYARLFSAEYRSLLGIAEIPAIPYWVRIPSPRQISFRDIIDEADINEEEFFLLNAGHNQWLSAPTQQSFIVANEDAEKVRAVFNNMSQDEAVLWVGYRVRKEEDVQDIADKFDIENAEIERINNVAEVRRGHYVILPVHTDVLNHLNTDDLEVPPQTIVRHWESVRYTVRRGDTLWAISRNFGLSVKKLMRLNGLRTNRILPKQQLVVAGSISTDEPSVRLADDYNRKVIRSIFYRVRRGDSLHSIADKFNVDINELKRWNETKLRNRYIYPGQGVRLYVDVTDL